MEKSQVQGNRLKLGVTVSIGATLSQDGDTPAGIIQRADGLLYCSKRHGRNCCTIG